MPSSGLQAELPSLGFITCQITCILQDMFDKNVGPFQQKYVHLVEDIHSVYGTAKEVSTCIY